MVRKAKGTTLTAIYQEKLAGIDVEIRRVHGRMFRWANRLDKLIKSRSRFERLLDESTKPLDDELKPLDKPVDVPKPDPVKPDDPLDVRSQPWMTRGNADDKAAAEIKAAQQAKAKIKAKASGEKSRAKRRGELRKMPLTGKAALAAIRDAK